MSSELIREIADYMIKTGTVKTTSGNYIFYFDELAKMFRTSETDISTNAEAILDELIQHEEFCFDGQELEPDCFSLIFYLRYCPNCEMLIWEEE